MTRIEESVTINRPVEEVFTYTTVAKNWPKWQRVVLESEQTSEGEMGVGTTFKGKNHMMGRTSGWTAKVTKYDPYKRWGKLIDSGSIIVDDMLIFDPVEGGTRFTMVFDMKVSGLLKLLSSMIISSTRKELQQNVSDLKTILETQP